MVPTFRIKGKVRPRTGNEDPGTDQKFSPTRSLTLTLDQGGWPMPRTGRFTPGKETRYNCIGGWVGPRTNTEGCGKSLLHCHSIPGPSSPQRTAIPATLSRHRSMRRKKTTSGCLKTVHERQYLWTLVYYFPPVVCRVEWLCLRTMPQRRVVAAKVSPLILNFEQ